MKETEKQPMLDAAFEALNEELCFMGKRRVWEQVEHAENVPHRTQGGIRYRAVRRTVLCLVLLATTALSLGNMDIIRQIVTGKLTATQVEELHSEYDGEVISSEIRTENRTYLKLRPEDITFGEGSGIVRFTTLEGAQKLLPFTIVEPAWLPDGCTFAGAQMLMFSQGVYDEEVRLCYSSSAIAWDHILWLSEAYVGPDCELRINTSEETVATRVGEQEAILRNQMNFSKLAWIHGNYLYELSFLDNRVSLEEALCIAESVPEPEPVE